MKFIEPHPTAGRGHGHQVGGEPTVVCLLQVSIAKDQRISQCHEQTVANRFTYRQHIPRSIAEQRHLGRDRVEGVRRVRPADGPRPTEDRRRGLRTRRHLTAGPAQPELGVELRIAGLGGIDEDAARRNPGVDLLDLVGREGARREDE